MQKNEIQTVDWIHDEQQTDCGVFRNSKVRVWFSTMPRSIGGRYDLTNVCVIGEKSRNVSNLQARSLRIMRGLRRQRIAT